MHKKGENKYAYLDQLSTPELQELLRADIDSQENGDDEAIFYILEVMEKREREHPSDASSDLDRCWNDFQTLYHTPEGAGRSLYPTEDPAVRKEPSHLHFRHRKRIRWAVLAAVVALLVVSLTVPVAGFSNLFEMIGTWTAQQFTMISSEDGPGGYTEDFEGAQVFEETPGDALRQALKENGITESVVPTWMPEGFKIQGDVLVQEMAASKQVHLYAIYSNGEDNFSISITDHIGNVKSKIYEKTAKEPVSYVAGGVKYYLFRESDNLSIWSAVCYHQDLELIFNTTLSESVLKQIIDSIYEE